MDIDHPTVNLTHKDQLNLTPTENQPTENEKNTPNQSPKIDGTATKQSG